MVLLRGLFGWRGSLLPTALNVAQCLGWTVVEVVIIATTAHGLANDLDAQRRYLGVVPLVADR